MSPETLAYIAAGLALAGLMAYAILGGADFGGGVWDLLAIGPRARQQRDAIARAMGPVWEANHVWLIFVVVVLFVAFPTGYAALVTAMFIPFHLALVGIMLRGAAFVFRGFDLGRLKHRLVAPQEPGPPAEAYADPRGDSLWGAVFGVASLLSPVLLGAVFGVVTAGNIRLDASGHVRTVGAVPWLSPYSIACGMLALSTCAYLAAVYLVVETEGDLREDFRFRAILAGTTTAGLAALVLVLAWWEANWFFHRLIRWQTAPVLAAGLFFFAASAWAVFGRRYRLSRIFAAGEIILLLIGWGLAQQPYLVYPDMDLRKVVGPAETIKFILAALPIGALVLIPSLWLLFKVFKGRG